MFAVYWPVMAFVAAIVLVLAFLSLSLGKMCGARTEPLPERDLTTYLPEDVSTFGCYQFQTQKVAFQIDTVRLHMISNAFVISLP